MVGRIALTFLLSTLAIGAFAQPAPGLLVEEAPESLLELDIGDAEVDLFVSGNWNTGLAVGLGFTAYRDSDGTLHSSFLSPFPGLETVPFFNRVDLTLSLWLLNRYFFETAVSDEFELATLLFGYAGAEGELVQSVIIGNSAIEMGAYPYLGFGDSTGVMGREAPGMAALLTTENSSHEIMVRLEPSEEVSISYSGGRVISESAVDSAAYIRDRFFVLPDGGLDTLEVYAEAAGGPISGSDGRNYRLLDLAAETVFSLSEGTLSFPQVPTGRIVVVYTAGGLPVGDAALGVDSFYLLTAGHPDSTRSAHFSFADPEDLLSTFGVEVDWGALSPAEQSQLETDFFRVSIDGNDGMVLFEPGRYSPFALAGWYIPPTILGAETGIGFIGPGGIDLDLPLATSPSVDGRLVRVAPDLAGVRSYASRYPFAAGTLATPTPEIYGPAPVPQASSTAISFSQSSKVDEILLDADYVPGSVRVIRNGTPTTGFEVNDTGTLIFAVPLGVSDSVDVRYRTAASGGSGDLILGVGNRFEISPRVDADAALGMRWKPISAQFSTLPGQYPGYLALSGSARYAGTTFTAQVTAGASYSVPDTTGVLRINGMDGATSVAGMSPPNLFPGAAPARDPDPGDGITIEPATRGALIHADYTSAGVLGGREQRSYLWEPPPTQVFAYADGGRIGPYAAISNDIGTGEYAGRVMVMEYELADDRNWVAGTTRITGGRDTDLSGTTRIDGSFRVIDGGGEVRVFLQVGALSEDLDGDGGADSGASTINPYLPFNDPATGWTLQAGAVNQSLQAPYTEDSDGDGRPDPELADVVFTRELTLSVADDAWQTFEIDLTRAEQQLLRSARALRFLIQRDAAGGTRSGRVVFSDVRFQGSGFAVGTTGSADVIAREIPESDALPSGDSATLASAFPSVAGRLDGSGNDASVLAVRWSGLGGDSFSLTQNIEPVHASDYKELRLYGRALSGSDIAVTLRATSAVTGNTVAEGSALISEAWAELVVPVDDATLDSIHTVVVEVSGPDSGELLLDEISFWGSRDRAGLATTAEWEWSPAGGLKAGGTTIVDGITVRQSIQARSAGFAQGLSATGVGVEATTDLGATVIGAPVEIGVAGSLGPVGPGLRLQHGFTLPLTIARLTLTEYFRRSYLNYGETLTHDLGVRAGPIGPVSLSAGWHLIRQPERSDTSWLANGAVSVAADGVQRVEAELTLDAEESTDRELHTDNYPAEWANSFTDLLPSGLVTADRSASLEAQLRFGGRTGAVQFRAGGETESESVTNSLVAKVSAEVGLPLMFGDRVRVTPSATRAATLRSGEESSTTFAGDLRRAAELMSGHSYLIASWPFWELVDPDLSGSFAAATVGLDASMYSPSVSIEVSRPIRSSAWSLLLPSSAKVSASRHLLREDDAVKDTNSVATEISLVAPNVFGRLGVSPLFGFYDTDEVITNAAARVQNLEGGAREMEIDVDQITRLFWLSGHSLEVVTSVTGELNTDGLTGEVSGSDLRISVDGDFEWTRPGDILERIERIAHLAPDASFSHTESVGITGSWADTSTQRILVKHTTELTLADRGGVSVYAGVGFGRSQQNATTLFLSGIQLGVEGHLRY